MTTELTQDGEVAFGYDHDRKKYFFSIRAEVGQLIVYIGANRYQQYANSIIEVFEQIENQPFNFKSIFYEPRD